MLAELSIHLPFSFVVGPEATMALARFDKVAAIAPPDVLWTKAGAPPDEAGLSL